MKKLTAEKKARLLAAGALVTRKPAEPAAPTVLPPVAVSETQTPHWVSELLEALSNLPRPQVNVAAPIVRIPERPSLVSLELEIYDITRERYQDHREISGAKVRVRNNVTEH